MTENKSAPAAFVHKTTPLNNSHTHLIVPGVYLGGEVSARSKELLLNLNVGGIVNCTEGPLSAGSSPLAHSGCVRRDRQPL